jgi:PAS domain S-box-containing protein
MHLMKHLKILILEDSADDVHLICRELTRSGMSYTPTVVNQREEFELALETKPDIILSDHSLPRFNSIEALKIYQEVQSRLDLFAPFILVTGAVSEEFAVQCIKAGADDYILKDRLKRLPSSIHNAVEKARIDAERRQYLKNVIANEAMLRHAEHLAHLGSWEADLLTAVHKWSDESFRLYGYQPGEVQPGYDLFISHIHPDDVEGLKNSLELALAKLDEYEHSYRIVDKNGQQKYVTSKLVITRDSEGKPVHLRGFLLDITQQKEYIRRIELQNTKLKEIAWIQSHGVRAPLARIMGLVNIIHSGEAKDETDRILNFILESVGELDTLVREVVRKTEGLTYEGC